MTWSDCNQSRPDACAARRARLARDLLNCAGAVYGLLEVPTGGGEPVDARLVDASAILDAWGPLRGVKGKWLRHALPNLGEEAYEQLRQVVLTGEVVDVELSGPRTGERLVRLRACRLGHLMERLVGVLVLDVGPDASTGRGGR